jgi:NADPH:quinone reductase-like Zn-dependent oxidoreductase
MRLSGVEGAYKVLGWDAVGEVAAMGEEATEFKPGDVVYYAGNLNRQGSNSPMGIRNSYDPENSIIQQ